LLLFIEPVTVLDSNAETGRAVKVRWPKSFAVTLPAATAEWTSIALGGVLFAMLGIALAWSLVYVLIAAVGFVVCTWLAQSLARALICVFSALGLLGAILALASRLAPEALTALHMGWTVLFAAWWLTAMLGAAAYRRSGLRSDFGMAEMLGCGASIAIAAAIAVKLDFYSDLVGYLTQAEDNAAWVGIATRSGASDAVTPEFAGGAAGSVVPLLLGLLQSAQQADALASNAAFAAYALGIAATPLVATSLLRSLSSRSPILIAAFVAVIVAWAYHVPALLASFGHLSAMLVFLGLLLFISFAMFDREPLVLIPIGVGLAAMIGGSWFPIAPLAACIAFAVCLPFARENGITTKALFAAGTLLVAVVAFIQLAIVFEPSQLGDNGIVAVAKVLLSAQGGTASIDPTLTVVALGGVIGLTALATNTSEASSRLATVLVGFVLYLVFAYSASYALEIELGYGIKKITFILVSAILIGLISAIPRFNLPRRPLIAAITVLGLGSLIYGGGGELLSRTWPGELAKPIWLAPARAATASEGSREARPMACFSNIPGENYLCTRWAGELAPSGDGAFYDYRASVVSGGDVAAAVAALRTSGTLAESDLIFLTKPDPSLPWSRELFLGAHRVIGLDGKPIARPIDRRGSETRKRPTNP
jgi:hypothetical protein